MREQHTIDYSDFMWYTLYVLSTGRLYESIWLNKETGVNPARDRRRKRRA